MLTGEIAQHRSIGLVFSLAFLFIAVLIKITTMHRVLQSQRMQLGILKALGFKKRKLLKRRCSSPRRKRRSSRCLYHGKLWNKNF